jgi:hypothetical protein
MILFALLRLSLVALRAIMATTLPELGFALLALRKRTAPVLVVMTPLLLALELTQTNTLALLVMLVLHLTPQVYVYFPEVEIVLRNRTAFLIPRSVTFRSSIVSFVQMVTTLM